MSPITRSLITGVLLAGSSAAFAVGCGSAPAPTLSTTPATAPVLGPTPVPGASGYTISGVVLENGVPIAGAGVNAFVQGGGFGYSYTWAHGPLITDSNGLYRMTGLAAGAFVWFQVYKDGYVQQCAVGPITVQSDRMIDLALVSKANVTASVTQAAPGLRSVSGTVVEMTAAEKRPVAGAYVDFEPLMDFPAAITVTDASGRFALCGLPADQTVQLGTASGNRVAWVSVPPGQTAGVEITLP